MEAERSTFAAERSVYEGGAGLRFEDVGVSNACSVANLSQEQDRAFPSRPEHGDSTRGEMESPSRGIAAWRNLSSASERNRVAGTRLWRAQQVSYCCLYKPTSISLSAR